MKTTAKQAQPLATTPINANGSMSSPSHVSVQPNGIVSKHTSQAHQPSPLRKSSPPDLNVPLQVKPLKAPNSPLLFQGVLERKSPRVGGKSSPLTVSRKPLPPEALTEGLGLSPTGVPIPSTSGTSPSSLSPRVEHNRLTQQTGKQQARPDRGAGDMTAALASMSLNGRPRPRKGAAALRPAGTSSTWSSQKSPLRGTKAMQPSSSSPRIRKGQKLEDIQAAQTQPMPALAQIDSPFQVQEYIALLVKHDPHNVQRLVALPQSSEAVNGGSPTGSGKDKTKDGLPEAEDDAAGAFMGMDEEPVQSVDTDIWIFEQLRRLVLDFTSPWLTALQRDCDRDQRPETCHAMNAEEWMYLCASHGEEKQCCAIDYVIHTLDGTTALLNSQRHFPSRTYVPTTSLRHFGSVSRRLSRIFVHAFEHHREVFEACEAETSLYARFLALVERYDLIAVDALPKLGKSAAESAGDKSPAANGKEAEEAGKADEAAKDSPATKDIFEEQDDFGPRSRPPASVQKLFDAGPATYNADDDEDDDGGDDEIEDIIEEEGSTNNGNGKQARDASPSKEQGTALERSDTTASRVTAVARDASPSREDAANAETGENHAAFTATTTTQSEVEADTLAEAEAEP